MRCEVAPVLHLDDGFDLRPAQAGDASLVAQWMAQPHIVPWWESDWPVERWAGVLEEQAAGEHSIPCLVALEGRSFAYVELYRVRHDRLAEYYAWREHDWGLPIAIGDVTQVGQGIGRRLLRALADAVLRADPRCDRVVAEPDLRNTPSLRAFAAAGFEPAGELQLPEKTALLMVRSRTVEAS